MKRAVEFYGNKKALERVRRRIMKEDHSWFKSAKEYVKLYESARRARWNEVDKVTNYAL